jgi:beta-xylosidase
MGQYLVSTSDTPQGPFTIQNQVPSMDPPVVGDESLFVDEDDSAYLIHTNYNAGLYNGRIRIEKLATDYLSATTQNCTFPVNNDEDPALIKRNGIYYAILGTFCGFCSRGSDAQVWTASSPLGPYTYQENINQGVSGSPTIPAQQTYLAKITTTSGEVYIWMGDRWNSTPDGMKGHDFQYWSPPLQFDLNGHIAPLSWTDRWSIDLPGGPGNQAPAIMTQPIDATVSVGRWQRSAW